MLSDAEILVVDDEVPIVELVQELLTEEGYTVRTACDGATALLDIQEHPPALLLIDNAMPVMTGLEVLARLRSSGFTRLPVVGMSAASYPGLFLQAGANDFLPKPFSIDALLSCVARHLDDLPDEHEPRV